MVGHRQKMKSHNNWQLTSPKAFGYTCILVFFFQFSKILEVYLLEVTIYLKAVYDNAENMGLAGQRWRIGSQSNFKLSLSKWPWGL